MTDNEIIKALECCIAEAEMMCNKCLLESERAHYPLDDIKAICALDLINRQKAEIERLSCRVSDLAEIEKEYALKYGNNHDVDIVKKFVGQNAIKEFAEKLKNKSELLAPSVYKKPFRAVSVEDIDTIVKEMTESEE